MSAGIKQIIRIASNNRQHIPNIPSKSLNPPSPLSGTVTTSIQVSATSHNINMSRSMGNTTQKRCSVGPQIYSVLDTVLPRMLINILWPLLLANKDGMPIGSILGAVQRIAKDCGTSCTEPITTKQQTVFWSVSQSRRMSAMFVGSCGGYHLRQLMVTLWVGQQKRRLINETERALASSVFGKNPLSRSRRSRLLGGVLQSIQYCINATATPEQALCKLFPSSNGRPAA